MVEYELIRESRKSLKIIVEKGCVIVKAPTSLSKFKIEEFLSDKKNWIIEKTDVYYKKYHHAKELFDLEYVMLFNQRYKVMPTNSNIAFLENDCLYIPKKHIDKNLLKSIVKCLLKFSQTYLYERIKYISEKTNLLYKNCSLSNAKSRWGSCKSDKSIRLSWRLIMMDKRVIDYVIVHELCHTRHLNHSKDYWGFVGLIMPDYKLQRKALKENSIINELYR